MLPFSFALTVLSELQLEHLLGPIVNAQTKKDQLKVIKSVSTLFQETFLEYLIFLSLTSYCIDCEGRTPRTIKITTQV